MIRTVLVDDEPPARRKLRRLLATEPDIAVIGEAESAAAASDLLNREKPELVFLDIGLPDATGFDVIEALEDRSRLLVVFVTAFDEFALRAFEVHAIDYLVKPVQPSRLAASTARIRHLLTAPRAGPVTGQLEELISHFRTGQGFARRLLIREEARSVFVDVDHIDWVEAARNYVCIHSGSKTYIHRSSLDSLAEKLEPKRFRRVSRSEIVNVRRIASIRPAFHGDQQISLMDGTELTWTRRYRPASLEELETV